LKPGGFKRLLRIRIFKQGGAFPKDYLGYQFFFPELGRKVKEQGFWKKGKPKSSIIPRN